MLLRALGERREDPLVGCSYVGEIDLVDNVEIVGRLSQIERADRDWNEPRREHFVERR